MIIRTYNLSLALAIFLLAQSCKDEGLMPSQFDAMTGKVVFVGTDASNRLAIFVSNVNGTEAKELVAVGDTVYAHDRRPDVGPQGPWRIYMLMDPRWASYGDKIVFTEIVAIDEAHIAMMNADGTDRHEITGILRYDVKPQPSPDGMHILYLFGTYLGAIVSVNVIDTSGQNDTLLINVDPSVPRLVDPVWSPNSDAVYYSVCGLCSAPVGDDSLSEIHSINIQSRATAQITHNRIDESHFLLSPGASKILFVRGPVDSETVYCMDLSTNKLNIIVQGRHHIYLRWLPDESGAIFIEDSKIYITSVDGSRIQLMHDLPISLGNDEDVCLDN